MAVKGRPAHVQLRLLRLLSEVDRQLSGSEMADLIGGWAASSVYAALASLQADGLIAAEWNLAGPRPRRVYRITAIGQAALTDAARWSPGLWAEFGVRGA